MRVRWLRRGRLTMDQGIALGSLLTLAVLLILLNRDRFWSFSNPQPTRRPLVVYAAAVMAPTVEKIGKEYETVYGVPVIVRPGGSQTLLVQIETTRSGDLYIPADSDYLERAAVEGLMAESLPAATMKAVLAVRKGNPKNLHGLEDLLREDVILAQPDPDAAAAGKVTRTVLGRSGWWDRLQAKTKRVSTPTVTAAANAVQVGSADAAIVWDVSAQQTPGVESVALAELGDIRGAVGVGVLTCTDQPTSALRFARYLTARDRGLPHLVDAGFVVVAGDAWAETPQLHLQGSPLDKIVLETTVDAFERREGVRVHRVYDLSPRQLPVVDGGPDNGQLADRLRRELKRAVEDREK